MAYAVLGHDTNTLVYTRLTCSAMSPSCSRSGVGTPPVRGLVDFVGSDVDISAAFPRQIFRRSENEIWQRSRKYIKADRAAEVPATVFPPPFFQPPPLRTPPLPSSLYFHYEFARSLMGPIYILLVVDWISTVVPRRHWSNFLLPLESSCFQKTKPDSVQSIASAWFRTRERNFRRIDLLSS